MAIFRVGLIGQSTTRRLESRRLPIDAKSGSVMTHPPEYAQLSSLYLEPWPADAGLNVSNLRFGSKAVIDFGGQASPWSLPRELQFPVAGQD
jgi:hypothetical protein